MSYKKRLIFFPLLTKKYALFAYFLLGSFARDVTMMFLGSDFWGKKNKQKRFFDIVFNLLCDLSVGIFVLIYRIRVNKDEQPKRITTGPINLYIYNDNKRNTWTLCKKMSVLALVDFSCQVFFFAFAFILPNLTNRKYGELDDNLIGREYQGVFLILDVGSRYLFSRMILKTYFYRHHKISFLLNVVGFILLGIVDFYFVFLAENHYNILSSEGVVFLILLIVQYVLYSLEDVLNKKVLVEEYLTPYSVLFLKAVFEIPLFGLVVLFVVFNMNKNDFKDYNHEVFIERIIARIIFVIAHVFRSIFLVKIIDTFSAPYFSVVKVLESLFLFFVYIFKGAYSSGSGKLSLQVLHISLVFIAFVILSFSTLMHNEIIIVNKFGLEEFTQYGLDKQAQKDINDAFTDKSKLSDTDSSSSLSNDASFNVQNLSGSDE